MPKREKTMVFPYVVQIYSSANYKNAVIVIAIKRRRRGLI